MFAAFEPVFSHTILNASNTPSSMYSLKEIFLELVSGFFQEIKKVLNFYQPNTSSLIFFIQIHYVVFINKRWNDEHWLCILLISSTIILNKFKKIIFENNLTFSCG